ncbi:MAG: SAF domain-containing protein [Actinomycetota bacterium]
MFWLTRPPYLRWAAAASIVVFALVWDLRSTAEALYPFASKTISPGAPITDELVEWRPVPMGIMAMPDLSRPVASREIEAGEPIVPSAVSGETLVPEGWWSVPVALPATAEPGARVRLIGTEMPFDVEGVVVSRGTDDLFSYSDSGSVAVPPDAASNVAVAALDGTLIVLLEP